MRDKKLVLRGGKRVYKRFSLRLIRSSILSKINLPLKSSQIYNNKLIISTINKKFQNIHSNILATMPKDEAEKYPIWKSDIEVELNDYISVRLNENETQIYVAGELFSQCKYLLLNIPDVCISEQVNSIDDAEKYFSKELEGAMGETETNIPAKTEFLGHISNLQAWIENDYDTRILHRNLAFPLLKRLADVGDPKAKTKLKEEVVKRIESGNENVIIFILEGDYIDDWTPEEIDVLLSIPHLNLYTYYLIYVKMRNNIEIPQKLMNLLKESIDQAFIKADFKTLKRIYPILPDFFTKKEFEEKPNNNIWEIMDFYELLEIWQKKFEEKEKLKIEAIEDHSFIDENNFLHIVYKIITEKGKKQEFFLTFYKSTIHFLAKAEALDQLSQTPIPIALSLTVNEENIDYDKIKYEVTLDYEKEMNDSQFLKNTMEKYIDFYAYTNYFPNDFLETSLKNPKESIWDLLGIENRNHDPDDIIERNADRWNELFPLLSKSTSYLSFKSFVIDEKIEDLEKIIFKDPNLIKKYLDLELASENLVYDYGEAYFLSKDNQIHQLSSRGVFYWRIKDSDK